MLSKAPHWILSPAPRKGLLKPTSLVPAARGLISGAHAGRVHVAHPLLDECHQTRPAVADSCRAFSGNRLSLAASCPLLVAIKRGPTLRKAPEA